MAATLLLDSALVVLLAVGSANRAWIGQHKRTRSFVPEDYELLLGVFGRFARIVVTPHILTEASNHAEFDSRYSKAVLGELARLIDGVEERSVASRVAAQRPEFHG